MATRKLVVNGDTGTMMIGISTIPDEALTDPGTYVKDLYFHSGLDYIQILQTITGATCTFAAVNRTLITWSNSSHGFC